MKIETRFNLYDYVFVVDNQIRQKQIRLVRVEVEPGIEGSLIVRVIYLFKNGSAVEDSTYATKEEAAKAWLVQAGLEPGLVAQA